MNKVELLGRLTKDVEIKEGKKVKFGTFTLAVKRPFAKDGETDVDFIDCVIFGKPLEALSKYTEKGSQIIVCGAIQNSTYEDKDKNKRTKTQIIVSDFYFTSVNKKVLEDVKKGETIDDLPF